MTDFTPVSGLLGGALIGASAALLLFSHGRVAGISGILAGLVFRDFIWRLVFVLGTGVCVGNDAWGFGDFFYWNRPARAF